MLVSAVILVGVAFAVFFIVSRAGSVAVGGVLLALIIYYPELFYCKQWPVMSSLDAMSLLVAVVFIMLHLVLYAMVVYLVFDRNFFAVILFVWLPLAILTLISNILVCYFPDLVVPAS